MPVYVSCVQTLELRRYSPSTAPNVCFLTVTVLRISPVSCGSRKAKDRDRTQITDVDTGSTAFQNKSVGNMESTGFQNKSRDLALKWRRVHSDWTEGEDV